MSRLGKNIFYNISYQMLIIVIPFVTLPYVSRVLSTTQVGANNFLTSIIQFMNILMLAGLNQYGVRTIRSVYKDNIANDKEKLGMTFFSLYIYQLIIGIVCICLYISLVLLLPQYRTYIFLTLPLLISGILDISWFFQGLERIDKVVIRNTIIKISTLLLIFIFVQSNSDFNKYLIIMSLGTFIGTVSLWYALFKYIDLDDIKNLRYRDIFIYKRTLLLLIPQVFIQIYITLDITILGFFTNDIQVAYYSQSQKLIRMVGTLVSSLSVVMLPRMVASNNNINKFNFYFKKSLFYTTFVSSLLFGTVFINLNSFVPWFFGKKYIEMIPVMYIVTPLILLIPIGGVFANQLALSLNKDKEYTIPVVIGAIISIGLNIVLIPRYGAIGAAMTSFCVELIVFSLRVFLIREGYSKEQLNSSLVSFLLSIALALFLSVNKICIISNVFLNMVFVSIIYCIIYVLLNFILVREFRLDLQMILRRLRK